MKKKGRATKMGLLRTVPFIFAFGWAGYHFQLGQNFIAYTVLGTIVLFLVTELVIVVAERER